MSEWTVDRAASVLLDAEAARTDRAPITDEWPGLDLATGRMFYRIRRPRFHVHFTPTGSSWMNQAERWFGLLTDKLIRRGVHTSVQALESDIKEWIATWNDNPRPFTWTKTADEILNSLADYLAKVGASRPQPGKLS